MIKYAYGQSLVMHKKTYCAGYCDFPFIAETEGLNYTVAMSANGFSM
jgi:hypothetical protein